jgi:hypothetical protein
MVSFFNSLIISQVHVESPLKPLAYLVVSEILIVLVILLRGHGMTDLTVLRCGKYLRDSAPWQPVLSPHIAPLTTSRIFTVRLPPPRSAGGTQSFDELPPRIGDIARTGQLVAVITGSGSPSSYRAPQIGYPANQNRPSRFNQVPRATLRCGTSFAVSERIAAALACGDSPLADDEFAAGIADRHSQVIGWGAVVDEAMVLRAPHLI